MCGSDRMSYYEEIEIEDMEYSEKELMYYYPCPCGDKFEISLEELHDGEDVAPCPSCTLRIKIIFEEDDLPALPEFEFEDEGDEQGDENGAVVEVEAVAMPAIPATSTPPVPVTAEAADEDKGAHQEVKGGETTTTHGEMHMKVDADADAEAAVTMAKLELSADSLTVFTPTTATTTPTATATATATADATIIASSQ